MILNGITVAMLTPFDENGTLDEGGVREIALWLVEKGIHGLFVCGTAGEGLLMNREERKRVAEIAVEAVGDRIPVVVHAGALSTQEAITLVKDAKAVGAKAAGMVAPGFYPLDNRCLINHFVRVAAAEPDFPIFLYNLPAMAKNDIAVEVLAEVVRCAPNIVGIKDSSRSADRLLEYRNVVPPQFELIVGSDGILLEGLQAGATGGVSALSSVFPEPAVRVVKAFKEGNLEEAHQQQAMIVKLREAVKSGPYLAAYKEALRMRGLPAGFPRSPLRSLQPEELEIVKELLAPLLDKL